MNKSVWKRAAAGVFSAAMLVTALTACGGSANASAEADTQQDTAANTSSAETVTVAVPGTPKPYNYVDDNGNLGGKKVPAGAGRANAQFMESYNKEHADNPIDIQYTDADASAARIDLYNGRYDACIYNQTCVTNVTEEYGYEFNTYEIPNADEIEIPEAWILYRQDETELCDKMDKALAAIKEDGTLSKLSEKYFGEDYVPQD
ncbi:transporter substrate-binding domain-containing protein [Butyricicoccus sp.]